MIISLDCETTGIDLAHGAAPFLVTTCDGDGNIRWWEWDVDPRTRRPQVLHEDVAAIAELVDAADLIYLHNAKFDARALSKIGVDLPWPKVRDTLIASHLLASNHGHRLDQLCVEYLGVDIEKHELLVKEVTVRCRAVAKRHPRCAGWVLADEGASGMPSVARSSKRDEDKPWKNDMWLPRAMGKACLSAELPDAWVTACADYANADSEHTLFLGLELERTIRERGLWKIYEHRLHLPRVACEMETCGITVRGDYTEATIQEFEALVCELETALVGIAAEYGHDLQLAEGAAINDNMRDFFYGAMSQVCPRCGYTQRVKHWNMNTSVEAVHDKLICPKCAKVTRRHQGVHQLMDTKRRDTLNLPVIISKKTGNATLDAEAMKEYLATTEGSPAEFVEMLADKRQHETALSYMRAYQRFWVPTDVPGYYRVHASLNPCATDHLRWASNSPNMQNVAGESRDISNRACFGPLPEREWWRMDFKSIENRLPAYESGEEAMIELFEKPEEPPFYGSYYLLNASITCPDLFWPLAEREGAFKREQPRAYKHVKFGTLAMQYGCGAAKADKLFGMDGAYFLLKKKLPKLAALAQKYLDLAERTGYVETLPDRTVDPARGYPILASRTSDNRVLSTTPFNYHISGTACWCKNQALIRCSAQCAAWRAEGFDARVVLEVHDELLFDFPRGATLEENLSRARRLQKLMESTGADLIPPIPTPVSVSYHTVSWGDGVDV